MKASLINILVVASIFLTLLSTPAFCQKTEKPEIEIGTLAPNFILSDIYGKKIEIEKFRGKVVIITITPTQKPKILEEERKRIKIYYEEHSPKGLELIRIAYKSGVPFFITRSFVEEKARESNTKRKENWITIIDWESSLKELFSVVDDPLVLVVDKHGVIRLKKNGELIINNTLKKLIEKLILE